MDALLDALPVHLTECLVQDNDPDGIVLAAVPDAADLGEGGQQGDVEGNLGLAAGFFQQGTGQALLISLLVRDDQVKDQVGLIVRKLADALLVLRPPLGGNICLIKNQKLEQLIDFLLIFLVEALGGDIPSPGVHQQRVHDHIVIIPVFRSGRLHKAVAVRAEHALFQRIVQLLQLLGHGLDVGFDFRDEIVPELVVGLLFGIPDFFQIFRQPDLVQFLQLLVEILVALQFNVVRHLVLAVILGALSGTLAAQPVTGNLGLAHGGKEPLPQGLGVIPLLALDFRKTGLSCFLDPGLVKFLLDLIPDLCNLPDDLRQILRFQALQLGLAAGVFLIQRVPALLLLA